MTIVPDWSVAMDYEPRTPLGKMLVAMVYECATVNPQAFKAIDVEGALRQADALSRPEVPTLSPTLPTEVGENPMKTGVICEK